MDTAAGGRQFPYSTLLLPLKETHTLDVPTGGQGLISR